MAKVFLDTNIFIDLYHRNPEIETGLRSRDSVYISPLSLHICCYVAKVDIPNEKLTLFGYGLRLIDFSGSLAKKCLEGPTNDYEDNVQLHSAYDAKCRYFLTSDKDLLKRKHFGMVKIVEKIPK